MSDNKTMEIKKPALIIASGLLVLLIGFIATSKVPTQKAIERKFASQQPDTSPLRHTMKLAPQATIEIENLGEEVKVGGEFTLQSKINIARVLPRTLWQWELPNTITALSPTSGYIENGSTGPIVTLRLRHDSNKNEKVRLRLYSLETPNQLIASATYNTLDQDKINTELLLLKERQDAYIEESKKDSN